MDKRKVSMIMPAVALLLLMGATTYWWITRSSTASRSSADELPVFATSRVSIGNRFEESYTYADVKFVNKTHFTWRVKRVLYSCCGNTEQYYRWQPEVVSPGATLQVHARLDFSGHLAGVAERAFVQTFWVELETDGNPRRGFLVAEVEGVQKNCLPDAPLYLHLKSSKSGTLSYRFHPEINLQDIKVSTTLRCLRAFVDIQQRRLVIRYYPVDKDYSGKLIIIDKKKSIIRTIIVVIAPAERTLITPRLLGFGFVDKNKIYRKFLRINFENNLQYHNEIRLLNPVSSAGRFRIADIKHEDHSVLLTIELVPYSEGIHQGVLRIQVGKTIFDLPWSYETASTS